MGKWYLLKEYCELDISESNRYLTESQKKSGDLYLTGKIQEANKLNGNNRIYPRWLLEREVKIYEKQIRDRRATGELDHPSYEEIRLQNVSHLLEKAWWKDDELWGEILVLPTPMGNILKALIESNVKVGISSRALGEVNTTSEGDMVENMQLICFDIVQNPSTKNAFMMKESQATIRDIVTRPDMINRKIAEILMM